MWPPEIELSVSSPGLRLSVIHQRSGSNLIFMPAASSREKVQIQVVTVQLVRVCKQQADFETGQSKEVCWTHTEEMMEGFPV